jgi:ABC-type polysaccharide/polyol phosphate export permease
MVAVLTNALRFPAVALRHRDVLAAFVVRDLKARYEGSLLGRLWPVLHPALLFTVYSLVFTYVLGLRQQAAGATVPEGWVNTFYLLTGILPWTALVESVGRSTPVVIENSNLIKKVAFPSELLPTYVVFVQLGLFAGVVLTIGGGQAGSATALLSNLVWLPVPLVLQTIFFLGLSMLFSALAVFVRDVGQVIPLAMLLWMFFTPVFYPASLIEKAASDNDLPWLVTAMQSNPMYHLLALWRGVFSLDPGAAFPLDSLWKFAAIAIGTFFVGHGCFHRWKGHFADEV